MNSELPKVLFPVLGRAMIHWVIDALERAGVDKKIVVIGYRGSSVKEELAGRRNLAFVTQEQQLGTGHAVACCDNELSNVDGSVFVLAGDSPLVQSSSLEQLSAEFEKDAPACLLGTLFKDNPEGLGRIVRDANGEFIDIVEHKDATLAQRQIREVNMSTYLFDARRLQWALSQLRNDNSQKEYYLTDCPRILKNAGDLVQAKSVLQGCEALSINTLSELALVEERMREMGYPWN
jgi:bifunctional UDP-N-acetylglucosamine pyrophosphorylase/glucosamine-1-phosphate N-acetyltransferase/UDP-N-acetylglucosamine pyrophosphorylase